MRVEDIEDRARGVEPDGSDRNGKAGWGYMSTCLDTTETLAFEKKGRNRTDAVVCLWQVLPGNMSPSYLPTNLGTLELYLRQPLL